MYAAPVIPLRDTIPSSRVPVVNYAIITANVAVFLHETTLGPRTEAFLFTYGLVPREFTVTTLFTSMFVHAGWIHILGNMLYLYIFGDNVEDRLGHLRYLLFYLLCGCAAGGAQALSSPGSNVPMVGRAGRSPGCRGPTSSSFPAPAW